MTGRSRTEPPPAQLRRLVDDELRALSHRYSHAADRHDHELLSTLFTADRVPADTFRRPDRPA